MEVVLANVFEPFMCVTLAMSLFGWLVKSNPSLAGKLPTAKTPLLPDPNPELDKRSQSICAATNAEIDATQVAPRSRKRPGGIFTTTAIFG